MPDWQTWLKTLKSFLEFPQKNPTKIGSQDFLQVLHFPVINKKDFLMTSLPKKYLYWSAMLSNLSADTYIYARVEF